MQKRGQLTIFIIIAIFIVGTVLLFLLYQKNFQFGALSPDAERVYNFVQDCIEQESVETIYQVAQNGGYFFPPNLSTESGVPIYYENGQNHIPSKEQIENEISFYINQKLFFCTRNFIDFPEMNINQSEIKTQTIIQDEKVLLSVDYPITIIKDSDKTLLKDFSYEIPVRMGIVYNSVEEFMQTQTESEGICLSCVLEISERNDLYVDMMDYDEQTVIFIFRDENSKIKNETFVWIFANR